ncbi:MAG: PQQ-binding-like beta-propeller repeat protein [Proteobacteria bacterium]|nr:PQQ-binding-like beta-propeller repeat protein [Pseudomonadota bacterium]
MIPQALSRGALALTLMLYVAGCSTLGRLNPLGRDDGPGARASEGERVSVIAFDQTVTPAEALKGVAFEIPPPVLNPAWPQPGGRPEQPLAHVQAAPELAIAWRRRIGEGTSRGNQVTATPIIADGRVYAMDGQATVSAHDATSGAPVWRVDLTPRERRDQEAYGGGLAFADGRVYVSSGFRFVAALDAATGATVWRTPVEAPMRGAPTVAEGRVFAVSADNEVLAFDTRTGTEAWTYQALVEPARFAIASSPAVAGDTVVAPFASGELVALRAQNGNELWTDVLSRASRTNALSELRDIAGRPVIYQGDVFATSNSGVFSSTDLRTGARRWSLPVSALTTPWPAGDVVYVMSKAGELICVARDSGQVYWLTDLNAGRVRKEGGFLGFFDREVRPTWSSPLLASNRLITVSTDGVAVAADARTGAVQKTVQLGSPAFIAPVAAGGTIYVVTEEAELIALR